MRSDQCPHQCFPGTAPVPGRGNLKAQVVLIGEAPGETEAKEGKPFVGQAGKILDQALIQAGLSRAAVYITNVVKCRPPGNRTPLPLEIERCKQYLLAEIEVIKPRVLVLLGGTATESILGKLGKITAIRGKQYIYKDRVCIPTLHPAYVLRSRGKLQDLVNDLRTARTLASDDEIRKGEYHLVDTIEKFRDMMAKLCNSKILAVDVETTGLDWTKDEIIGISLSNRTYSGYYVPLRKPGLMYDQIYDFWTEQQTQEILQSLRTLIESDIPKANQNIKFDMLFLRKVGIKLRHVVRDTMLTAYLLDEDKNNSKGLGVLSRIYPDLAGYKEVIFSKKDYIRTPLPILAEYGAKDVDVVLRLIEHYDPVIKAETLTWMNEVWMPAATQFLVEMESKGMQIDVLYSRAQIQTLKQSLLTKSRELSHFAQQRFDYNSDQAVMNYFKSKHGLILKNSRASTIKETGLPEADLIVQCRQLTKVLSTYFAGFLEAADKDGVVHSSYSLAFTDTGRLNSTSPNMQNVPARDPEYSKWVKRQFVARPGYVLIAFDYSQAEFRLAAWYAQDEFLLEAIKRGVDFHTLTASLVYSVGENEVTKSQRTFAKTLNFAILYGEGIDAIAQTLKVSRDEARQFRELFFSKAPKLKTMIDRFHDAAKSDGYVSSCFGRRRRLTRIDDKDDQGYSMRASVNAPIQSTASDYAIYQGGVKVLEALVEAKIDCYPVNFVHDAIYWECQDDPVQRETAIAIMKDVATRPLLSLDVKMDVDITVGYSWSEL